MIKAGADIEAESDDQWRPIHYAVFFGHYAIVKVLVDAGADVGAMTLLGKTPLIIAKEKRMKVTEGEKNGHFLMLICALILSV